MRFALNSLSIIADNWVLHHSTVMLIGFFVMGIA